MSDFKLLIYSDITSNISDSEKQELNSSLSDYLDIQFNILGEEDQAQLLPMETNCTSNTKFSFLKQFSEEERLMFKCASFKENQNTLTVFKNQTLFSQKQIPGEVNFQYSTIMQCRLRLNLKPKFIEKLNPTKQGAYINIMYSNFRMNPKNYAIEEFASFIFLPVDLDFEVEADIAFKKLSVNTKVEFDIIDHEISNEHKFQIEENSLRMVKNYRKQNEFRESLFFNFYIYEQNNEVTYLTLDDVLATLGGFLQIFLMLAEFVAAGYNQSLVERVLSHYCMENVADYDKILSHVKTNVKIQMDFYDRSMRKRKSLLEKVVEGNEAKVKSLMRDKFNLNSGENFNKYNDGKNNDNGNFDNIKNNDEIFINDDKNDDYENINYNRGNKIFNDDYNNKYNNYYADENNYDNKNKIKNIIAQVNENNGRKEISSNVKLIQNEYDEHEKKISYKMILKSPKRLKNRSNKINFSNDKINEINQIDDELDANTENGSNKHLIIGGRSFVGNQKTRKFNKSKDANDIRDYLHKRDFDLKKINTTYLKNFFNFNLNEEAKNNLNNINVGTVESKSLFLSFVHFQLDYLIFF